MKKYLAFLMAVLMMFTFMTACGNKDEGSENNNENEVTDNNNEETRTIVLGTTGSGEPYTFVDEKGNWTGCEADLWHEIAERTGWEIDLRQVGDTTSLFGDLGAGRVDVAANCYAITEKRLETYIASDPIYADAQVVIVRPESEFYTLEDLRGKTMGVNAGQAAQATVEALAADYGFEVITYETNGFLDCANGRVDSYASTVTAIEKAERNQGLEFRMLEEKLFGNNVGWWFADTEEGAALRDEVNEVLAEMHKDGTISEIVTKWFYEDLTQLISDEWLTATK